MLVCLGVGKDVEVTNLEESSSHRIGKFAWVKCLAKRVTHGSRARVAAVIFSLKLGKAGSSLTYYCVNTKSVTVLNIDSRI